jgi:hypothetical protein
MLLRCGSNQKYPIGRADSLQQVFVGGSAAQFIREEFPIPIRRILNTLTANQAEGGNNNVVAMWVNALLVERLGYELAKISLDSSTRVKRIRENVRKAKKYLGRVNPQLAG